MSLVWRGRLPWPIREVDEDGEAFQPWDQATFASDYGSEVKPSRYADRFVPVYGPGTSRWIGLTIEEVIFLYYRCRRFVISLEGLENFKIEVPGVTATGGNWDFVDDHYVWVPYTATIEGCTVLPVVDVDSAGVPDRQKAEVGWDSIDAESPGYPENLINDIARRYNIYLSTGSVGENMYDVKFPLALPYYHQDGRFDGSSENGAYVGSDGSLLFAATTSVNAHDIIRGTDGLYYPNWLADTEEIAINAWKNTGRVWYTEGSSPTGRNYNIDGTSKSLRVGLRPSWDTAPTPTALSIPFEVRFPWGTKASSILLMHDPFWDADYDVLPPLPTVVITCDKFWTWHGIYNEATGEKA